MKKSLLFSTVFLGLTYTISANASYCACAGRCSTGASCNCATGSCTIPARYAYGYVDTAAPVVYVPQAQPAYQMPTPYRRTEPTRKYAPLRAAPYMAVRLGVGSMEGDVKYKSFVEEAPIEGGTWQKDFDDDVFFGALAFGVKKANWRAELEGSVYSSAEKRISFSTGTAYKFNPFKAEIQTNTLLFNMFYDIPTDTRWTPFIGAGVGISHIKGEYTTEDTDGPHSESHKKTNFAWQVGAGLSYAVSGTVNLDFAYRYTHYGKAKLQSFDGCSPDAAGHLGSYESDHTDVKDITSHSLSAGVRFSF